METGFHILDCFTRAHYFSASRCIAYPVSNRVNDLQQRILIGIHSFSPETVIHFPFRLCYGLNSTSILFYKITLASNDNDDRKGI